MENANKGYDVKNTRKISLEMKFNWRAFKKILEQKLISTRKTKTNQGPYQGYTRAKVRGRAPGWLKIFPAQDFSFLRIKLFSKYLKASVNFTRLTQISKH